MLQGNLYHILTKMRSLAIILSECDIRDECHVIKRAVGSVVSDLSSVYQTVTGYNFPF